MNGTPLAPPRGPLRPLLVEVAPRQWDTLLWGSGLVALLGIAVSALAPDAAELASLFTLSLLCNGPYSPVLPASQEPLLIIYSRVYPPLTVAAIATLAAVLAEVVDFRLYGAAMAGRRLAAARESRLARWTVARFERAPFAATVIGAATPLPFWLVRCCAVVARYPLPRFLAATAAGRLPRFLVYATLGAALPIPGLWLLGFAAGLTAVWVLVALLRRRGADAS